MKFLRRTGLFLVLIGSSLLGLFVLSDIAHMTNFKLLVYGIFCLIGGVALIILNPSPETQESGRFRILKPKKHSGDFGQIKHSGSQKSAEKQNEGQKSRKT
jgi:hypothetical protein